MSVSLVEVINPFFLAPIAIEGDAHAAAVKGRGTRLSTIFKEMIMVDAAVVTLGGLILWLLCSPPYYDLRVMGGTSPDMQPQETGKMGLYYYSYWRVNHWAINFSAVSNFDPPLLHISAGGSSR